MLFNYNSGIKETFNRKGAYLPGQITKSGWKMVDAINSRNSDDAIEFGTVLKRLIDNDTKIPYVTNIVEDDAYTTFYGIAVRDVISQHTTNLASPNANFIKSYYKGETISVIREGYVCVPVQNGTPIPGDQVYVRVKPSLDNPNLPIGGIEAIAALGTVAWKGVTFESGAYFPVKGTNTQPNQTTETSQCATIFINKDAYFYVPSITSAPTANQIVYGTKMNEVVLNGGSAEFEGEEVPGKFVMNNPMFTPPAGTNTFTASFIPNDLEAYEEVSDIEVVLTVSKANPVILKAPTAANNLYYGTQLFNVALVGGEANTPGVFSWEEENTVPDDSGNQKVVFYPYDTDDFNDLNNIDVYVTVVKNPLLINENPVASSVARGSLLSTSNISGGEVVNKNDKELVVPGTWSWNDGSQVVNSRKTYKATFTPENLDKYETISVSLVVGVTD